MNNTLNPLNEKNPLFYKVVTDIRYWILFFFLLRLFHITNPPLETWHSWRQTLTNMVSRNFVEHGLHLLYPTIDMGGYNTGIIGSEFPFFNFLHYLVSKLFGYTHWYGRLINLIVSSIGILCFHKIVIKISDKKIAFSSSIILLVSIWFSFSRKIMPDTFSIALVLIGFYFLLRFILYNRNIDVVLYTTLCALGLLSKLPAFIIFSLVSGLFFSKQISLSQKISIAVASGLTALPSLIWYFYWVPHLVNTFHYQLYYSYSLVEGFKATITLLPEIAEKFYYSAFFSIIAFASFCIGIYSIIRKKQRLVLASLFIATIVFVFYIIKTGIVFPNHNYYIIPYVPIMSFIAGHFIAGIKNNTLTALLLGAIILEAIANQQHDFFIPKSQLFKLKLEAMADQYTSATDKIIVNGDLCPELMYFCHRKGWSLSNQRIFEQADNDNLVRSGASIMIVENPTPATLYPHAPIIYQDSIITIYDMK